MLKIGHVNFKSAEDDQIAGIIIATNGSDFERVDIIDSLDGYNALDTTNCLASYYRKNKEMYYGDDAFIIKFMKGRNIASLLNAEQKVDVTFEDGKVYTHMKKESHDLGIYYEIILENGYLYLEKYITPDIEIVLDAINPNSGDDSLPLNSPEYNQFSEMDGYIRYGTEVGEYHSLDYLKRKYAGQLDHIEEYDYVIVHSIEEADERLSIFAEAEAPIKAIDIESTGLAVRIFGEDVITGVVISYDVNNSTYFPFRQDKFEYNLPMNYLKKICDVFNGQKGKCMRAAYNAKMEINGFRKEQPPYVKYSPTFVKYNKKELDDEITIESYSDSVESSPERMNKLSTSDKISSYVYNEAVKDNIELPSQERINKLLAYEGIPGLNIEIDIDGYILSTLVNPKQQKGLHTLKNNTKKATGLYWLDLDVIFIGPIKFNVLPEELVKYYACPDAPNTIKVINWLWPQLPEQERGIFAIENNIVRVKAIMEFYGMRVEKEKLISLKENEEYKVKMLEEMFRRCHNTNANINSPDEKRRIFYDVLRADVEVTTTTGKPSTSNIALKRIIEKGTLPESYKPEKMSPDIVDLNKNVIISGKKLSYNKYPSLLILQAHNKAKKELINLTRILKKTEKDRVNFYINQTGTAAGRQTSDAHQYSDAMKSIILSDSPDHYLVSCDFKQVELRILAYLAKQEDLIELCKDYNIDIHRAIGSIISGKEIWEISDEERKDFKTVNFGVVYKMSEFGLAKRRKGPAYTKADLLKALQDIINFYAGLNKVNELQIKTEENILRYCQAKTLFGRIRPFPELRDPNIDPAKKQSLIRSANNMPVQGFGADLMKMTEGNYQEYIEEHGWDELIDCDGIMLPKVRLMLSIHDEVLISFHKSIPMEEIVKMCKICQEIEVPGAPPFFAAPAIIDNWFLGKKDAYEIPIGLRDKIIEEWDRDHTSIVHMETYLEDLNAYRKAELADYMGDLVKKYKTVDAVADHVRDPNFTHVLISAFIRDEEHKDLNHLERIHVAVERFMEGTEIESVIQERESDTEEFIASFEDLQNYIQVDDKGELIIEHTEDMDSEDEEDSEKSLLNLGDFIPEDLSYFGRAYFVYTADAVMIDVTDLLNIPAGELIHQEICKLSKKKGAYKVIYVNGKQVVETDMKIDYNPEKLKYIIMTNLDTDDKTA